MANKLSSLVAEYRFDGPVYVTSPTMPSLESYTEELKRIWDTRWLTNIGQYHTALEKRLGEFLGVEHCSLFCNGTVALITGLHALRIHGEVITTPFTFPATPHALQWNGVAPVFCDIEEKTFNIDPDRIESLITPRTSAILPVHVYGNPCDVDAIGRIAEKHGLRVIYDAAHAFGVKLGGRPLASYGDMSMLSFHATKLFTTIEGGALVVPEAPEKRRIDFLKNFGIADEETVIAPGINGKMNEFQAAFGLLHLEMVEEEIGKRKTVAEAYRKGLAEVEGISFLSDIPGVRHNYAYFPVRVEGAGFGLSRDELYTAMKEFNVHTRKYFYPLVSHYPFYKSLPSADSRLLPVAERVAGEVLCLPIYGGLEGGAVGRICEIISRLQESGGGR